MTQIPTPLIALLLMLPGVIPAAASEPARPNIIFILADDLGLDGVSCYGSDAHKTPQIDKLTASCTRFETCYAAPLCGPSRGALMTGRYAFRTGGLRNTSWRDSGPATKAATEHPVASLLKQAGYATAQAGKWRQMGETPHEWGFDEYMSDPNGSGWYWKNSYIEDGKTVTTLTEMYNPDQIQAFSLDFIRRHKEGPFFLYYAMHFVHTPIVRTPDSPEKGGRDKNRYDDTIKYVDKQGGEIVAELEKLGLREKTLVIFSGDNGTATASTSSVHGRMLHGSKASMFESGSRAPFISSWPGTTPAGAVSQDLVNFTDTTATFAELGGVKLPEGFIYDSRSIAPQLHGQKGNPREWAFVQLDLKWFVREPGWKMNEASELFDMSDAPFVEKPVAAADDTDTSKAAGARLAAVLKELNPASGKLERQSGSKGKKGAEPAKNDKEE